MPRLGGRVARRRAGETRPDVPAGQHGQAATVGVKAADGGVEKRKPGWRSVADTTRRFPTGLCTGTEC